MKNLLLALLLLPLAATAQFIQPTLNLSGGVNIGSINPKSDYAFSPVIKADFGVEVYPEKINGFIAAGLEYRAFTNGHQGPGLRLGYGMPLEKDNNLIYQIVLNRLYYEDKNIIYGRNNFAVAIRWQIKKSLFDFQYSKNQIHLAYGLIIK